MMSVPHSLRKWIVLLIASAFVLVVYLMQYQIAALAFLIVPDMGLDSVQLSNLMFAPMALAAVVGIPLGMLSDRFGFHRVVGVCGLFSLGAAFLRAFAIDLSSYGLLALGSFLLGLAPAALNSNVMRMFGAWFEDKASIAIGVYYAASGLGAALAMLISASSTSASVSLLASAVVLCVVIIAWMLLVRDAPQESKNTVLEQTSWKSLRHATMSSVVWIVALITGLGLAAKTAYLNFLPLALVTNAATDDPNTLAAIVTYGGILGCIIGPAICVRQKHPRAFVMVIACVAAGIMAMTSFSSGDLLIIILFGAGLLSSVTAPIVEAIPCALPSLRNCVSSAGGIIGSVSLAMTYVIPLLITAISEGDYSFMVVLTSVCFLLMVPFLAMLPGISPEQLRAVEEQGHDEA